MLFRSLVLQIFSEENLSFKDYQTASWDEQLTIRQNLLNLFQQFSAWRKLLNPCKWLEFLLVGILYAIINPALRLILFANLLIQLVSLFAWIVFATLLSCLISLLYFSEGLYTHTPKGQNGTAREHPFKETFDKAFDIICVKGGVYLYKGIILTLHAITVFLFAVLLTLPKIIMSLFSPINEIFNPIKALYNKKKFSRALFATLGLILALVGITVFSPNIILPIPALLYLNSTLFFPLVVKALLILFSAYILLHFVFLLKTFKIIFFDRQEAKRGKMKTTYIPLSDKHQDFDHKVAIDANHAKHSNQPSYSNAYSRLLFNSPVDSGIVTLENHKENSFWNEFLFSVKKSLGWDPTIPKDFSLPKADNKAKKVAQNIGPDKAIQENISEPLTEIAALITPALIKTIEITQQDPQWMFDLLKVGINILKPIMPISADDPTGQAAAEALEKIVPGGSGQVQDAKQEIQEGAASIVDETFKK